MATGKSLKTKSSAKKRFSVTGTGKISFHQGGKRHLMTGKSSKRTRSLKDSILSKGQADNIRVLLPH
ncbi:50S ribosomal protein L35 [Leptospirillum ferrooxidans]|jgi:large subunit ribosomal protein L35|uniref:Large ribosomal subunit protein bL35 n=1 Tax=Leptospirillum ferrooxidans (strain C2-3) TaxID=1162668 RepID=I0IKP5_LEPFC|nr:50S ribosomal protein L35 [Leptospirillum ferrooxidans]BAM05844.1 hypothetical protein LFE_0115 [Leptospirillum ferrooxidans C2-3]